MSDVDKEYKEWKIIDCRTDDKGLPHCTSGPALTFSNGRKDWFIHGVRHREDGPAIVYGDGDEEWLQHGKLHRVGGPAILYARGKSWCLNGFRHRIDGPAVEQDGQAISWFVHDRQFTEDEFTRFVDPVTGEVFLPPGRSLHNDRCTKSIRPYYFSEWTAQPQ